MVDIATIAVIGNTLVVGATFLATLYRIRIEHEQIKIVKQDAKAKECLASLRKYVRAERELLTNMDKNELNGFLDYLQKLGE
ncbi:MAG TPA: hypothetical protein VK209_00875 [Candidatus Sulfotelmatobacter sp.]|jgi:hypothetical protein|nr:hypothetical protein [Candidatus Sulfotelmatobacter sp.]